ncbi:gametocyte-specific factor 1 isoform X2 [Columba livia]|uniref:gametocyte-specific factor 1 isoform X2 n=1 Tax=Columba livia TaxID=8932 RepID=UPI0031BBBF1A
MAPVALPRQQLRGERRLRGVGRLAGNGRRGALGVALPQTGPVRALSEPVPSLSPHPPWSWRMTSSYPEVAKELATCPFNARHLVPRADLSDHIKKCNDKGFIEQDIVNESSGSQREQMNAVSTWQAPPCDEDWETESLEQSDPPFIWGMTNSGKNSATFEKKNCLPSRVRAPGSFPYSASWKG